MKVYTIPTTNVHGYGPQMTIMAPSDTPKVETRKEVILNEHLVL